MCLAWKLMSETYVFGCSAFSTPTKRSNESLKRLRPPADESSTDPQSDDSGESDSQFTPLRCEETVRFVLGLLHILAMYYQVGTCRVGALPVTDFIVESPSRCTIF